MSAAPVAAPLAAPASEPQRHTWLQALAYHLLPGLAPLACMLALAPIIAARGLPPALATWAVGLVGAAWLAPFVEELYFRGFLLPRLPLAPTWAPAVNALLFSAYHFWSPWQVLVRTLAIAPMNHAVLKTRSIWVSVFTHSLLNTATMIVPLVLLLR